MPSGGEGGAYQIAELVVRDPGGVVGPQLDGPLARYQLWVAGGEAGVVALPPAVDRYTVLPHTEVQTIATHLVRRYLVRDHHRGVRVDLEDQPVEAVEQGPALGRDGVDLVAHGVFHRSIISRPQANLRGDGLAANGRSVATVSH